MDRIRPSFEQSNDFTSAALLTRLESSHSFGPIRSRRTICRSDLPRAMIFASTRIQVSGVVLYTTVSFVNKREILSIDDLHERSTTGFFFCILFSCEGVQVFLAGKRRASAIGFSETACAWLGNTP